jgi:hypothetical protein
MSKRSDQFKRNPRNFYPTPEKAVRPLLHYLPDPIQFDEPCAGDGALVGHLESVGHFCGGASDIHPMGDNIDTIDALNINECYGEMFVTNPPWPEPNQGGDPALSILMHLSAIAPTWALLPADFAHNVYFGQIETRCRKIVSVGRVKWIEGTKHSGKDNAAWYLFDGGHDGATVFHGRFNPDLRCGPLT